MTVRIWYEINQDAQYLAIYSTDPCDRGSRTFVAGKEPITVKGSNAKPPDSVCHLISTIAMVELLDALLAYGIRPSSNAWSSGHVSDLKAHIGFAESVANKLLDRKEPS